MIDAHNLAKQREKMALQHEQEMEAERQRHNAKLMEQTMIQEEKRRNDFRSSLEKQI